jgi:opacity protein-like surface antigen
VLLPAAVAAQQSIAINFGAFTPTRYDGRPNEDVLVQNLNYHYFDIKEFDGFTFSGEWLVPLGQFREAGVGVGYYQQSVPAVYIDYVNDNGAEIAQEFKLRVVPITGMVRVLPLGRRSAVQPYFGAGIGILPWRYSETGEFIASNGDVFIDSFVGSGTAVGPVAGGGVRFAVSTGFAFGGEIRYQWAEGDLNRAEFNGSKIDLGGFSYLATVIFRF